MNGLALCSGSGSLELGLHIAEPDYRAVCHVERQAEAAARLVARMEEEGSLARAPIWDDVATFDGRPWRGLVDIVTAGYPCQGESNAGRRLGTADPRWIWPQIARIVEEVGPRQVFLENVAAHLGRSFPVVLDSLQDLGFRVAAGLFSAFEVGASHERKRLFILADSCGAGLADAKLTSQPGEAEQGMQERPAARELRGSLLADSPRSRRRQTELRQARRIQPHKQGKELAYPKSQHGRPGPCKGDPFGHRRGTAGRGGDLANATPLQRRALKRAKPNRDVSRLVRGAIGGALPLPGFAPGPSDYAAWRGALEHAPELEPSLCRVADGLAHRVERLQLCGNGVVPLAAAYAYRTLKASLRTGT